MIYNFTCDYYANKKYETKSYLPMLDFIFIDAEKENYIHYYNLAMSGLLSVKNDKRVEQVILTIREGITMIKPIKNN